MNVEAFLNKALLQVMACHGQALISLGVMARRWESGILPAQCTTTCHTSQPQTFQLTKEQLRCCVMLRPYSFFPKASPMPGFSFRHFVARE